MSPPSCSLIAAVWALTTATRWWEGALHMVPPPGSRHQLFGKHLLKVLDPLADRCGLIAIYETGLYDPDAAPSGSSYRVPDQVFARPEFVGDRGVEGRAALVVEVLSPDDETFDKLPFYARVGVEEVLIIDPITTAFEVWRPVPGSDEEAMVKAAPAPDGTITILAVDVRLDVVEGPRLGLRWEGGRAEI